METMQVVSGYLAYCQAKGDSASTLVLKQSILGRFAQECPELPLQDNLIFNFLAGCGKSLVSRKSARDKVRAFYTWACGEFDLPDPMPQVAVPQRGVKRPRPRGQVMHMGGGRTDVLLAAPRRSPAPPVALLSTSEAIAAFLSSKQGRWKDNTYEWYNLIFAPFIATFKHLPLEPEPIEEFLAVPDTKHQRWVRFRGLRTLYIWLHKRRDLPNPFDKIDPYAADEAPVIPLDDEEIGRLLDLDLGEQEEAIIHALLTTGMRPGEARNLKPESVMEETIVLNGKTGIDRVPVKPYVRDLLLKVSGKSYVFEDSEERPLTKDGFYRILENILLRAGIREGRGGARVFRHTFITRIYDESGDPYLAQRLARHATLAMTKHYEHAGMRSTIRKYQGLDFLPEKRKPEPGAVPEIGALEEGLFEPPPFDEDSWPITGDGDAPSPEEMEGSTQLGFEIPAGEDSPTPPYTIKEYANPIIGPGSRCWRIIGSNGAWWPITGKPRNFLSFGEAQNKMRELWAQSGQ